MKIIRTIEELHDSNSMGGFGSSEIRLENCLLEGIKFDKNTYDDIWLFNCILHNCFIGDDPHSHLLKTISLGGDNKFINVVINDKIAIMRAEENSPTTLSFKDCVANKDIDIYSVSLLISSSKLNGELLWNISPHTVQPPSLVAMNSFLYNIHFFSKMFKGNYSFSNCSMYTVIFEGMSMSGNKFVALIKQVLDKSTFCEFINVGFLNMKMDGIDFRESAVRNCYTQNTTVKNCNFSDCKMTIFDNILLQIDGNDFFDSSNDIGDYVISNKHGRTYLEKKD